MKSLFRAALASTALLLSMQAHATTFSFSYTFADQSTLTGTLTGDTVGDYVEHIADLHVLFNGVAFTGPLLAAGYDTVTGQFGAAGSAILSTHAELNNFVFADQDPTSADPASNYFYFINDPLFGREAFAVNYNPADIVSALDNPAQGAWSLVARAADVPEPSGIALAAAALGALALARRRA